MSSDHPSGWVANLRFDPTAWVAPGAIVVGDVVLGARSSVWFNTVIRGDTAPVSIGNDSNVQDNSVVHIDLGFPAVIGARVTIGHRAIVHGCVIEDDCLIGMGAIILSGARIGAGSLVAAGALVREKQEIPPGSLVVGAPARVAGPVGQAHQEAIARGSQHYVELSRSYMRRGLARSHPARHADIGTTSKDQGPMAFVEWEQLLSIIAELPARVGRLIEGVSESGIRQAPAPGRWSAVEIVCHLRDSDREVFVPRLSRFLAETEPFFENTDMRGWDRERDYASADIAEVLAAWRTARAEAVDVLVALGPSDWTRLAFHSERGPYPLADMVRSWANHDLAHRRQLVEALRAVR